jgi:hypothetical protein
MPCTIFVSLSTIGEEKLLDSELLEDSSGNLDALSPKSKLWEKEESQYLP